MKNENYILAELKEISPSLALIEKTNVYSVSSSYFDTLTTEIIEKINMGAEPAYYFSPVTPYSTPQNYFDDLAERILHRALTAHQATSTVFDEMEEIAPILNTISKKPVFTVPEGYFAKLEQPPVREVKSEAKVVSLHTTGKRILRYAVAAVVAGILGIGVFLINGNETKSSRELSNNAKADVNKLSEQEIIEFLKTNSATSNVTSASSNSATKEQEIESALKKMTDKEIQQFLQEYDVQGDI